jgi:hypothetical protein
MSLRWCYAAGWVGGTLPPTRSIRRGPKAGVGRQVESVNRTAGRSRGRCLRWAVEAKPWAQVGAPAIG